MRLSKEIAPITDEEFITLWMTPDEYGEMCKFMTDNGVGYGQGRAVTEKWRKAREEFKKK